MPAIEIIFDDKSLIARFDKFVPDSRAALNAVFASLPQELASTIRASVPRKSGEYLASIYGGQFDKGERVGGFVRSGDPVAHLVELGTKERFRRVTGSARGRLREIGTGSTGTMPAFPSFEPAFEAAKSRIAEAIKNAVEGAFR